MANVAAIAAAILNRKQNPMQKYRLLLAGMLAVAFAIPVIAAEPPVIIDTHAHLENPGRSRDFATAAEGAVQRMNAAGISRSMLMPPPQAGGNSNWEIEQIRFVQDKYPGRFILVGGGGSLNGMIQDTAPDRVSDSDRKAFRARAEELIAAGARGFGEIAIHHMSLVRMGPNHPYEWTAPDHPLLLLLADIAAEKGVPIDIHMDLVPEDMPVPGRPVFNLGKTPQELKENLSGFERLLSHNRNAKIIWAHAGTDFLWTRTVQQQAQLLARNPNLYMSLRFGNGAPPPVYALDPTGKLKAGWLQMLQRFPDRFVLGSDSFHAAGADRKRGPGDEQLEAYRTTLEQMPPELAEAIGHLNAERLFRLTNVAGG